MGAEKQRKREFLDVLGALRQIIRATDLHSKHVMKVSGLTVPQLVIMIAIEDLGAVTVRQVSQHVSLSQATVTIILNRLEDRGFILRSRNTADKRVVNSSLTEKGKEALLNTPPLMDGQFMRRYSKLDPKEREQILSSLQQLASLMVAVDGEDDLLSAELAGEESPLDV